MTTNLFGDLVKTDVPSYATESLNQERDAYFTDPVVAEKYLETFYNFLQERNVDISEYTFLEPSAGSGSFYNILPDNKLGLDIEPMGEGIVKQDFLQWQPDKGVKYLAIGNPPFGKNGTLAVAFMKRLAKIDCPYLAFIIPMGFTGSMIPKTLNSVGWFCEHSEKVPDNAFIFPDGRKKNVHTLFQIWSKKKISDIKRKFNEPEPSAFIYAYRHAQPDGKLSGIDLHNDIGASIYVKKMFSGDPDNVSTDKIMTEYNDIDPTGCYVNIVMDDKNDIERCVEYLKNDVDWNNYLKKTNLHGRYITLEKIKEILVEGGFVKNKEKEFDGVVYYYDNRQEKIKEKLDNIGYDVFMRNAFFSDPNITTNLDDLLTEKEHKMKYNVIKFHNKSEEGIEFVKNHTWLAFAKRLSNSSYHVPIETVKRELIKAGFYKNNGVKVVNAKIYNYNTKQGNERGLDTYSKTGADLYVLCSFFMSDNKKIVFKDYNEVQPVQSCSAIKLPPDLNVDEVYEALSDNLLDCARVTSGSNYILTIDKIKQVMIDCGFYKIQSKSKLKLV